MGSSVGLVLAVLELDYEKRIVFLSSQPPKFQFVKWVALACPLRIWSEYLLSISIRDDAHWSLRNERLRSDPNASERRIL